MNGESSRSVEDIIGTTTYLDCSQKQRDEIAEYIHQDPDGVKAVAEKVALEETAGKIDSAVPVLLARLRNGQHLRRRKQQERSELDIVTFAERRYHAKMADFAKHHANPDEWAEVEALEYAVDWTIINRKDCAMTSTELMDALCRRLGVRYKPRGARPPAYTAALEQPPTEVVEAAKRLAEHLPQMPDPGEDDDIPGYGDAA